MFTFVRMSRVTKTSKHEYPNSLVYVSGEKKTRIDRKTLASLVSQVQRSGQKIQHKECLVGKTTKTWAEISQFRQK